VEAGNTFQLLIRKPDKNSREGANMWLWVLGVVGIVAAVGIGALVVYNASKSPTREELTKLRIGFQKIRCAALANVIDDPAIENPAHDIRQTLPEGQTLKLSQRLRVSYAVFCKNKVYSHFARVEETTPGTSDAIAFRTCLRLMEVVMSPLKTLGERQLPEVSVGGIGPKSQGIHFALSEQQHAVFTRQVLSDRQDAI